MGELGLNKIMGAAFATALVILGLQTLSGGVFGSGGHHGGHAPESLAEWAKESFPGYYPEIKEVAAGGEIIDEVFDFGLALATADLARGERSLGGKCVACHSWTEGGANGTGPALYGVVGRDIGSVGGFNYSRAFQATEGDWTYERLDAFLQSPKNYISGTNMSFAGVRNENERAAIIAYLASLQSDAPEFPAPLAQEAAEIVEDVTDGVEAVVTEGTDLVEEIVDTVEEIVEEDGEN